MFYKRRFAIFGICSVPFPCICSIPSVILVTCVDGSQCLSVGVLCISKFSCCNIILERVEFLCISVGGTMASFLLTVLTGVLCSESLVQDWLWLTGAGVLCISLCSFFSDSCSSITATLSPSLSTTSILLSPSVSSLNFLS